MRCNLVESNEGARKTEQGASKLILSVLKIANAEETIKRKPPAKRLTLLYVFIVG